ncbi:MAG: LysM peptidoglycan-binding domain-containing protein [bacterium]
MRKYILATLFLGLFVLFLEPAEKLLSNFLKIEEPTVHEIQQNDWLSKIARQYYGDPSYWKELRLINRAPEGDLIFPGESIIVPSFKVVEKIRKTTRLSEVNELVRQQQDLLADYSPATTVSETFRQSATESEDVNDNTLSEASAPVTSNETGNMAGIEHEIDNAKDQPISTVMLAGAGIFLIALIVGIYKIIRRRRADEVAYYGATQEESLQKEEKSIYLDDFNEKTDDKQPAKKQVELV